MNPAEDKQKAWHYFEDGDVDKAYYTAKKLNIVCSEDAEIKYLLGCCLAKQGKYAKAVESLESSLKIMPNQPYTYIALGGVLNALNQKDQAIKSYKKALQLNPKTSEAHIALGDVALSQNKIIEARNHYYQAGRLEPHSGLPHYKLGLVARREKSSGTIILQHFLNAVEMESNVPDYLHAAGECLTKLQRYDEAVVKFTKAISLKNDYVPAISTLLTIYVKMGEYAKVEELLNLILQQKKYLPDVAISLLLVCKHLDRCEEALKYAKKCLSSSNIKQSDQVNINFHMAMVLDACKQHKQAWLHLKESKTKKQLTDSYDAVMHKKTVDDLIASFSPANLFNLPKSNVKRSNRPIFIIGMPRSGTSLTEQILASHPDVFGGGELTDISELIKTIPTILSSDVSWPACVTDINQDVLNKLTEKYLFRLQLLSTNAQYVTDKMPHNFYALGFIQMMFPEAKVIHCSRNPMDTCLSIYFQNFLVGHEYSNKLFNLGAHYHQYQRLMKHWHESLAIKVFEMEYESLVTQPKRVVEDMLEFCGLDWNDNCLKFHSLDRNIETASFDQVRQPLHKESISRWKSYYQYLSDLRTGLDRGF